MSLDLKKYLESRYAGPVKKWRSFLNFCNVESRSWHEIIGATLISNQPDNQDTELDKIIKIAIVSLIKNWKLTEIISVFPMVEEIDDVLYVRRGGKICTLNIEVLENDAGFVIHPGIPKDLVTVCGLDPKVELAHIYSNNLESYLNKVVITDLIDGAATVGTLNLGWYDTLSLKEKCEFIAVELMQMDNVITRKLAGFYKDDIERKPNWVLMSNKWASIFREMRYLPSNIEDFTSSLRLHLFGKMLTKYNVYTAAEIPENTFIIGYKGQEDFDAGYLLCPHILMKLGEVSLSDFIPAIRVSSVYGKHMTSPVHYGVIRV